MRRRANLSDWIWGRTVLRGGGAADASGTVVRWKRAGALAARREARSWRVCSARVWISALKTTGVADLFREERAAPYICIFKNVGKQHYV